LVVTMADVRGGPAHVAVQFWLADKPPCHRMQRYGLAR
jgi:hypothetical protein